MSILSFYLRAFIIIVLFASANVSAQVCSGSLGDPILGASADFGTGTDNFAPPLPSSVISYTYASGSPSDGQYSLVKTTRGLNVGWHQNIVNHTQNSENGYMLLVNADYAEGVFFQKTIDNLCPNNTYEFAAWIINILINSGIKPNVKFTIENNYENTVTVLKEFSTGDILEGSATDWKQYGTIFTTPPNLGTITLKMTNINPGGIGNDLAIDDITFRACGPTIITSVANAANFANNTANVCFGDDKDLQLSASISSGYNMPEFQWQELINDNWINSQKTGAQNTTLTVNSSNLLIGNNSYRLLVAENGNLNTLNCRVISPVITINLNAPIIPVATNSGEVCENEDVSLNVDQGISFIWKAPDGTVISREKNPVIRNISSAQAGVYTVSVKNAYGCESAIASTEVKVHPKIVTQTNISNGIFCEGSVPLQLSASGGTSYRWTPTAGLSDPNIANPTASPANSTIYTVAVSNDFCTSSTSVDIKVIARPEADAGEDLATDSKQPVKLNGKANGDDVTVLWSPADYLSDPTALNPVASPPTDITYTLTVSSLCNVSTDEVFVKVYPEIIIPNTFTPNGDNVNDVWTIPALSAFENYQLKIFNRNGSLIYHGAKNAQPWDGKFNNKELPVGTYYYTLFLAKNRKTLNGWVMIVR